MILIRYYYQTKKTRALYISMDEPAGRPTAMPPNSVRLRDYSSTVPKLMILGYWQPELKIWLYFGLDQDPEPKWRTRTVAKIISACVAFAQSIRVPLVVHVSVVQYLLFKFWDVIICLGICKGQMDRAKVLHSKPSRKMPNEDEIVLPVMDMWKNNN